MFPALNIYLVIILQLRTWHEKKIHPAFLPAETLRKTEYIKQYFPGSECFTKPYVEPGPEILLITIEPVLGTDIKAEAISIIR